MERVHRLSQFFQKPKQEVARDLLKAGLFSIEAISNNINKRVLSMLYSPGVGAACMAIKDDISKVNLLTLRARSVAIVSDGSILGSQGRSFMPVMDWMIVQLKYYAGLDSFPFVIRPTANIESVLEDLSTCYGTVLYLDKKLPSTAKIPQNLLFIQQSEICQIAGCQVTDAEITARVISGLIHHKKQGLASKEEIKNLLHFCSTVIEKPKSYPFKIHSGDLSEHSINIHEHYQGKIEIKLNLTNVPEIKKYFTQEILTEIVQQKKIKPSLCAAGQMSAIVTDGTAILGFGDIGPEAGLPVMEGKSLLFKVLGDVNVVPVCIKKRKDPKEAIQAILDLLSAFEAINLEDFKAPECFQIEQTLSSMKKLPIFHDDQHGTAIVALAAYINACKLAKRSPQDMKIVINGAGAAGVTITKLFLSYGVKNIIICDSAGPIYKGRTKNMNETKQQLAEITNLDKIQGKLEDTIKGCDVFIGVSVKGAFKKQWIKTMGDKPIIFAMANPDPEITYEDAMNNGCFIYGSGRSDQINQINNSLAFPGIFKGIHDHNLNEINEKMKLKAAEMIGKMAQSDLKPECIMPDSLNRDVAIQIAKGIGQLKQ